MKKLFALLISAFLLVTIFAVPVSADEIQIAKECVMEIAPDFRKK